MEIKIIKISSIVILLTAITACTPTTVIPHTGNKFTVTATAATKEKAGKLVVSKSKNICQQQNAKPKIIDQKTIYQGLDKNQQELVTIASDILPPNKTLGPYTPVEHEHKSTLTFKCVKE